MSGYNLVLKVRRLEEECSALGFMMAHSRHSYGNEVGDIVSVKPKDKDSLPIYSRDAELFTGTLDDLSRWLQGIQWARKYDSLLFGKRHDEKRERKEQDIRNEMLVQMLKGSNNESDSKS